LKPSQLVLRCIAERDSDGSWFAICIDLNLYAREDSFEQVKVKLNKLIIGYLREALTKDAEYIEDLLPRRAPLYFWIRYALAWCQMKVHQVGDWRKFKLSLPMVPAS
jgi:hypothetical protein